MKNKYIIRNNHRSSKSTALFLYLKSQYNPSNKIQIEDIVPCHTKVWGAKYALVHVASG